MTSHLVILLLTALVAATTVVDAAAIVTADDHCTITTHNVKLFDASFYNPVNSSIFIWFGTNHNIEMDIDFVNLDNTKFQDSVLISKYSITIMQTRNGTTMNNGEPMWTLPEDEGLFKLNVDVNNIGIKMVLNMRYRNITLLSLKFDYIPYYYRIKQICLL